MRLIVKGAKAYSVVDVVEEWFREKFAATT